MEFDELILKFILKNKGVRKDKILLKKKKTVENLTHQILNININFFNQNRDSKTGKKITEKKT